MSTELKPMSTMLCRADSSAAADACSAAASSSSVLLEAIPGLRLGAALAVPGAFVFRFSARNEATKLHNPAFF